MLCPSEAIHLSSPSNRRKKSWKVFSSHSRLSHGCGTVAEASSINENRKASPTSAPPKNRTGIRTTQFRGSRRGRRPRLPGKSRVNKSGWRGIPDHATSSPLGLQSPGSGPRTTERRLRQFGEGSGGGGRGQGSALDHIRRLGPTRGLAAADTRPPARSACGSAGQHCLVPSAWLRAGSQG